MQFQHHKCGIIEISLCQQIIHELQISKFFPIKTLFICLKGYTSTFLYFA